jgi:Zn-dependent protease with chaperone function
MRAWAAMAGLLLFVALYFALSGWFAWTAWRLFSGLGSSNFSLWGLIAGACAAFLAVFMLKALFFVKHAYDIDDIEITREQQPQLFAFIDRIADEARAPRAHKVYLSPRVNAAVFYDLSLLNLFLPSKKNLEIGLGLVNVVTLGELKAVLAHEFGHFAQRSMAVDRWVYIAQQIAGHIIAKRDMLDKFLQQLSRLDLRVAWIGWILSLTVWSIRSLMEILFRGVVIAQRALSRQMEFQADLVAVSLTGSDALIHALHRLGAADEAWERTMGFAGSEAHGGRAVRDLFAIQSRIIARVREILDQPDYGEVPPMPTAQRAEHRVFKAQLAQPPRMWSTHPPNEEREHNAKQQYVEAPLDSRSAWDLFKEPQALREQLSAHLLRSNEAKPVPIEESLAALDKQYDRAYLDRAYRGAYLGRSIARHARTAAELYAPTASASDVRASLDTLYPESLGADIERLSELHEEKSALEALRDQVAVAPGGIMRHRGSELRRNELPTAIAGIEREIVDLRTRIEGHDKRARRAHLAAAESLGRGWPEYLRGLLSVHHYADHTEANLGDAQGALVNVYNIVTADGRVSNKERERLVGAAHELHSVLERVHQQGAQIVLDRTLLRRLETESWQAALGKWELPPPNQEQLGDWLNVIDSWVGAARSALGALRTASLEQLLLSETQVAKFHRGGMQPTDAPPGSSAPAEYASLVPGNERPRQTKLGWWDKFQTADGAVATGAKMLVAGGIVGGVMLVGAKVGEATLTLYNGLSRAVVVAVGTQSLPLVAQEHVKIDVPADAALRITASTTDGQVIESFTETVDRSYGHYVYNVAGAAPLYNWTAVYGGGSEPEPTMLGAPRWSTTSADHVFEEPPREVRSKSSTTRNVLASASGLAMSEQLDMLGDDPARERLSLQRARWDSLQSRNILSWMWVASRSKEFPQLLADRLAETPNDAVLLRMEQDVATDSTRAQVCERQTAAAAKAAEDADLQYAAIRCMPDGAAQSERFLATATRFPDNGWLAMAAGYTYLEQGKFAEAAARFDVARQREPAVVEMVAEESARLRRLLSGDQPANYSGLIESSDLLRRFVAIESGEGLEGTPLEPYHQLALGRVITAAIAAQELGADGHSLLILAAASDGAGPELIDRALRIAPSEDRGIHAGLAAYGLAARASADTTAHRTNLTKQLGEALGPDLFRTLEALRITRDTAALEADLPRFALRDRGLLLSTAVVMLGPDAPTPWRDQAKRLLFVAERPYFK